MDIKKEAVEVAEELSAAVNSTTERGLTFLKSSMLRTLVLSAFVGTLWLTFIVWSSVYASVRNNDSFETFINTAMAIMASPLFIAALYFYADSLFALSRKFKNLSKEDKDKHSRNLIIAAVAASLAGWGIKLFFLPAVFYILITIYMVKILRNKTNSSK